MNWILNSPEGFKFLLKISNHQNLQLFETEQVKILVSYLWSNYQYKIIIYTLIPYILYHSLFLILVFYNESYFLGGEEIIFHENQKTAMIIISILLLIFIAYFFAIIVVRVWQ